MRPHPLCLWRLWNLGRIAGQIEGEGRKAPWRWEDVLRNDPRLRQEALDHLRKLRFALELVLKTENCVPQKAREELKDLLEDLEDTIERLEQGRMELMDLRLSYYTNAIDQIIATIEEET